ncbi:MULTISPECIES: rhodanese-like domain-containing protein [Paenibacillus]|uniref:Rhodanese-like domain-containing protein n=1 Tax=Paenibacillus validus TaxID=44253 RepID=A0A7X2ZCP6_9BACL|nr:MULTISPECIES: rhodanese-like domain-containing protein [Paenibacillus]MUG71686.1 rhodanese-like domain-containing protein [Paenibacillus validus]
MSFDRIGPDAFKRKLERGELEGALAIDVREPMEWEFYHWDELQLMPMMSIPEQVESLPKDRPIYVVCAHGVRSANVCHFLSERGFEHMINVEGGMAALAALKGFQYD